jgi:YfiH family protein
VRAAWSDTSAGDLRPTGEGSGDAACLEGWVARVTAVPSSRPVDRVHWMRQVHGSTVVLVPADDSPGSGAFDVPSPSVRAVLGGEADALVSGASSTALAVLTADCASIALGSPEGVFGAVHAGWRGLVDGVVERAVSAMRANGATEVVGALGPCIRPECYEFSPPDLDRVAGRLGDRVRAKTAAGRPALDLPAAVAAALAAAGARQQVVAVACTGCGNGYFSHRVRGDTGRQAMVVWSSTGDRTG